MIFACSLKDIIFAINRIIIIKIINLHSIMSKYNITEKKREGGCLSYARKPSING